MNHNTVPDFSGIARIVPQPIRMQTMSVRTRVNSSVRVGIDIKSKGISGGGIGQQCA